jgi:hypothetical protein
MANGIRLNDVLRFDPGWAKDPVPPWLFEAFDKAVLKQLALVSLESTLEIQQINIRSTERAIEIINKAKF